jgi:hypothetical protein
MMADSFGPQGLAAVAQVAQKVKDIPESDLKAIAKNEKLSDTALYASNSPSGTPSSKKSSMPDLNGLLGGLLGKKPGEEKKDGLAAANFGNRKPAQKEEGFHDSTTSLFDVVQKRYQQVSTKFLAGTSVVATPQTRTPSSGGFANPYSR